MSAFIGEIRIFAGDFAPVDWAFCDGQLLPISEYVDGLYSLIGTTYGGDGITTFALPDFRGRIPIHQGTCGVKTFVFGEMAGNEKVRLEIQQIPGHAHSVMANNNVGIVDSLEPGGIYPAKDPTGNNIYSSAQTTTMVQTLSQGNGEPHDNVPPFLCLNFIIALYGVNPPKP